MKIQTLINMLSIVESEIRKAPGYNRFEIEIAFAPAEKWIYRYQERASLAGYVMKLVSQNGNWATFEITRPCRCDNCGGYAFGDDFEIYPGLGAYCSDCAYRLNTTSETRLIGGIGGNITPLLNQVANARALYQHFRGAQLNGVDCRYLAGLVSDPYTPYVLRFELVEVLDSVGSE